MFSYVLRNYDRRHTAKMRRSFGALYLDLNHQKKGREVMAWPVFFLLRRLILAGIVVYIDRHLVF